MGNRRAIVSIVAVALLIALLGACGSSSKSTAKTRARTTVQAKAARAKVLAAKRRLAAAKVRVAAQRRALAAVVRRRQLQARAAARAAAKRAASTTTTTVPSAATPTTVKPNAPPPSTRRPTPPPVATVAGDVAAIQQAVDTVNAAFAKGVAAGIAASEFVNYYVSAGVYSDGQCSAFEAARGLGVVADRLVVRSVTPTPGFVDPILHGVPKGRVYGLTMDDVQTQIVTKQTRTQSVTTHATVGPKGRAQLFFRCR